MEQNKNKIVSRLRLLLTCACLLSGFLAGENIFRYAMEVPAWRHINIAEWGEYSRHADLANGAFLLPFEAVVGALLLIAASIIILKGKGAFQSAALYVHSASFFALTGLVLTFFVAPYMLSVRTIGNDPELLQQAFNHFHYWGFYRAIAQILSFCACVLAIGKVFEIKKQ
jgi:hypothetical protein